MMAEAAVLLALLASVRSGRARIALPISTAGVSAPSRASPSHARSLSRRAVKRAQYALCCTADDVALNLPDQRADATVWAQRSMAVRYFGGAIGGEQFWVLLDR
jgi:type VI secretion system protein ImpK